MVYSNNYGNRGGYSNGGGYQQNNYGNKGGYQKQPVDIDAEINARIDLFVRINEVIKARGLDPSEFAFAVGGWTTSLILEQKKGK